MGRRDSQLVLDGQVTLLYLKQIRTYCIAQGNLLNIIWQPGWEGSLRENGYIYVCVAESLCCPPETMTILLISYTAKQNEKFN